MVPTLLNLCLLNAIDNVSHLEDVGDTSFDLLEKILPHCTPEQLRHIEKGTKVVFLPFPLFLPSLIVLFRVGI